METLSRFSWHVSRRVPRPVHEAAAALERLASQETSESGVDIASLSIPLDAGRRGAWAGPVRVARARLDVGGIGPGAPVEIELRSWSSEESELAIRPAGRRAPLVRASRYFAAANAALDTLSPRITESVTAETAEPLDVPLRRAS